MSAGLAKASHRLPAMDGDALDKVCRLEDLLLQLPQVDIETTHVLHAGVYLRTVRIPAGTTVTGALIKIPTTLIVSGHVTVYIGDDTMELVGYHVIPASAGRKQAVATHSDTDITMLFRTDAMTIQEA